MSTAVAPQTNSSILSNFMGKLHRASSRVLLLDYDGTIAPFTVQRYRAFPYPTVPELLDCIMSTCRTAVALISGRPALEIPPLLGLLPHPAIWGANGLERLTADDQHFVVRISGQTRSAITEAADLLCKEGIGDSVEQKTGAVAVHWRGLVPSLAENIRTKAYRVLSPLALRTGLLLAEFDGGLELRVRTRNKADVVQTILSELPGDVPVAYLGDDLTDEDAFRALSGRGLTALVRSSYRFTSAQVWLRPPTDLVQFLSDWVRACGGDM